MKISNNWQKKILISFVVIIVSTIHFIFLSQNLIIEKPIRTAKTKVRKIILKKSIKKIKKKKIIEKKPKVIKKLPTIIEEEVQEKIVEQEIIEEEIEEAFIDSTEFYADEEFTDEPQIGSAEIEDIKNQYIAQLYQSIKKYIRYPKRSKQKNHEGIVQIAFTIQKNGTIINEEIETTSNYIALDRAALRAIKRLKTVTPIPILLEIDKWDLIIPITFELTKN